MELIHILPKGNLKDKPNQKYELYLADEILKDPDFYREYVKGTPGYKILDNSLNELGASMSLEQLSEAADIICPDEVVYPDSIDPEESNKLFWECRERVKRFSNLRDLKKMVVVHSDDWFGAIVLSEKYSKAGVDVLAYSKVTSEQWGRPGTYDGRVSVVAELTRLCSLKTQFHFLGFSGFVEFEGYREVSKRVRSMDSRVFLESRDLWSHRDNILSHVSLGNDRVIENLEEKMAWARERYYGYGLC